MIDILVDNNGEIAIAANKNAMLVFDNDQLLQDIKLEAKTSEGDCFYDKEYGWSLLDFLHREIDDLMILEVQQRIKEKLKKHTEIDQQSINIGITENLDMIIFKIRFKLSNDDELSLEVNLDRVKAEVI